MAWLWWDMNIVDIETVHTGAAVSSYINADAAAWATVAIAAIVAFVEIRNYRVSRDQIRHDLFERRFAIYKAVQIFLSKVMQEGKLDYQALPEFYDAMQKARFLFGKDVNEYLEEIKSHVFALNKTVRKMNDNWEDETKRLENVERIDEEFRWLSDQLDELHMYFGKYINFPHI